MFNQKLSQFIQDRDQLDKDLVEFRNCKEAQEQAHKLTVNEFKGTQAKIIQELELREYQLEKKERQTRTFENDLYRREKQITELILKNERFDRSFANSELRMGLRQAQSSISSQQEIDFNKSGALTYSVAKSGSNIDQLLNQFEQHQTEMIKREAELQKYLSTKEESMRNHELSQKIEESLEQMFDKNGSPKTMSATGESSHIKTHQS